MLKKMIVLLLALVSLGFAGYGNLLEQDFKLITKDVDQVAAPGVPGPICIFKPFVVPVVVSGDFGSQQVVAAAGRTRTGRFFCFGHNGYLSPKSIQEADTSKLMENVVKWLAQTDGQAKVAIVDNKPLTQLFKDAYYDAQDVSFDQTEKILESDILVFYGGSLKEKDKAVVANMLDSGKGVMTAFLGWGWKSLNPGQSLTEDCVVNSFYSQYGVVWADGYCDKNASGLLNTLKEPIAELNSFLAFDMINKVRPDAPRLGKRQIGASVELAALSLPSEEPTLMRKLFSLAKTRKVIPTPQKPVLADDIPSRVAVAAYDRLIANIPPEAMPANPASRTFPGTPSSQAPRVSANVSIDLSVPRWHSTGLYASAGEVIEVSIHADMSDANLRLVVGSHKDKLWKKDKWSRYPDVSSSFKLNSPQMKVASPFGGLIYVDVPKSGENRTIEVTIKGAVNSPYYVLGETTDKQWEKIRRSPAPWAELQGKNIIITVPSDQIRNLEKPQELMELWDKLLDTYAELKGEPAVRVSPERIVPDVQISAGYMHSGYPIMTLADQYSKLADINTLKEGSWGLFHELGHNHQESAWTFSGTTEVTVNLFTVYAFDKICGVSPIEGRVNLQERIKLRRQFEENGSSFEYWKSKPFVGLVCYLELQEAFGWDSYKKVFRKYNAMAKKDLPKTDQQKIDTWVLIFSQTVERNLTPFFRAWAWPVSDAVASELKDYPVWPALPVLQVQESDEGEI